MSGLLLSRLRLVLQLVLDAHLFSAAPDIDSLTALCSIAPVAPVFDSLVFGIFVRQLFSARVVVPAAFNS